MIGLKQRRDNGAIRASKYYPNTLYTKLSLTWDTQRRRTFIKLNGKCKAFFKGGNSSCHLHICQHFKLYKEKCEEKGIPMHHWAIPRTIWKDLEEEKEAEERGQLTKKQQQQRLDFKTATRPREFTRTGTLHAVTMLIATNYQVSY